jgi:hypothetical protein
MKAILFCQNNYAFGILEPIRQELIKQNDEYIWYVKDKIAADFPFKNDPHTTQVDDLILFLSDVIFVPGNEVPHYLRGLKTQIFHGLAGEKKGHFRIRHYFDLYLTQGPYFTNRFLELKSIHKDFDVIETGWPKLDIYGQSFSSFNDEKEELLNKTKAKKIVLYAPTFSPKLTSAPFLKDEIVSLAQNKDYLILFKFHPLMASEWVEAYKNIANEFENVIYIEEKNIIKYLIIADLLISDTSSVVYEFLLLDKPVITFNSISTNISWNDVSAYKDLVLLVDTNLTEDPFKEQRAYTNSQFHPYKDGKSAYRMVEAVKKYIAEHGVPEKRKISFLRRMKINSIFGRPSRK